MESGRFVPPLFHVNVYPSGIVCLNTVEEAWCPSLSIKQILLDIQDLLDNPNPESPAQAYACAFYKNDRAAYARKVRQAVLANPPDACKSPRAHSVAGTDIARLQKCA